MSKITLEEFFNRDGTAAQKLKDDLYHHIEVICDSLPAVQRKVLLQLILISVRQTLADYGDEL